MNTEQHLDWLRSKLTEFESDLADAERTVAILRPAVNSLRSTIEALSTDGRKPLQSEKLFEISKDENKAPIVQDMLGKPFMPGNKNPEMPKRRPLFAQITLLDAAQRLITNSAKPLHANVVAEAIFEIHDSRELKLAKRSVASELYRGAKKGLWMKVGPNLYQRQ